MDCFFDPNVYYRNYGNDEKSKIIINGFKMYQISPDILIAYQSCSSFSSSLRSASVSGFDSKDCDNDVDIVEKANEDALFVVSRIISPDRKWGVVSAASIYMPEIEEIETRIQKKKQSKRIHLIVSHA